MAALEGRTLNEFKILSRLGEGGMGTVYVARQASLNREVAIKVLSPHLAQDAGFIDRFRREASLAAGFSHPDIVQVFAAGEQDGLHYIAMEYVPGSSLQLRLLREGRIAPAEALAIAIHVARALDYAWQKARLIHRDVKPGNILISNEGHVKLADLGMAKCLNDTTNPLTATGTVLGTPYYVSPEQARSKKEIDFRADIYSLGCTLYHMLTGKIPYEGGDSVAVMLKQVIDPPPNVLEVMPDCPPALVALLGKMLAKHRERRQQSYEELIAEMTAIRNQLSQQPAPVPKRRPRDWTYAVVACATALLVAGLWMWSPWKSESSGQRIPEKTMTTSTGMELVWIPPGEFLLGGAQPEQDPAATDGAPADPVKRGDAKPRKATLRQGFWIGRTEVTVGQWRQFVTAAGYQSDAEKAGKAIAPLEMGKSWGDVKGANWRDPHFGFAPGENHPVSCISWNDAMAFCAWLDGHERQNGRLPPGCKFRLPSEAEWEYACRAGTSTRFWWGDSPEASAGRLNWGGSNNGMKLVSTVDHYGARGRNKFGLADMLGNVAEWCLDDFDPAQAHEECYKGNAGQRVIRGGSIRDDLALIGSAARKAQWPSRADADYGFRVTAGPAR
jgi:eukaryotic-like serine/threonine-protein kinase